MNQYERRFKAAMSNGSGRQFEQMVKGACEWYKARRIAKVEKMPEPFRVLEKSGHSTIAKVRFIAHAEPDFIGCLRGGRAIVFETKYTSTPKLHQNVLTPTQAGSLQTYYDCGAVAAVCAGIRDRYFMIPWPNFANMKEIYGHQFVCAEDIKDYEVRLGGVGVVMFLDYVRGGSIKDI